MKVYEIQLKVYLLKNITLNKMQEKCAAIIDKAFFQDTNMQLFHEEKKFKNYCFGSLHPIEPDKLYKAGNVYTLNIRTIDENLKDYLLVVLENIKTNEMKGLTVSEKIITKHPIREILTLTPLIIKDDRGYWREFMSGEEYANRLFDNLIKKYKVYTQKEMDEDFEFYDEFRFKNPGPIVCHYKRIKLLGDKVIIKPTMNESTQELIYMALGTGLGEGNARGYGFLSYR